MSVKPFIVAGLVLVLLNFVACGPPPPTGANNSTGAVRNVSAVEFKFDPGDQTFKSGQQYTVNLTNNGALQHTWVLKDANDTELVKLEVNVGQKGGVEFTAPAPGAYNIICDVAGHKEAGMQAKATVQ